jgi:membrane-bound lytic murein transglycosylase B
MLASRHLTTQHCPRDSRSLCDRTSEVASYMCHQGEKRRHAVRLETAGKADVQATTASQATCGSRWLLCKLPRRELPSGCQPKEM